MNSPHSLQHLRKLIEESCEMARFHWNGRLGGIPVSVAADTPAPIRYLDRFARRSGDPADVDDHGAKSDGTVVHVNSPALVDALSAFYGSISPGRLHEVFTGTRYEFLPGVEELCSAAFRRCGGEPHWVVCLPGATMSISASETGQSARQPIRLLREMMLREAEEHLVLHGAAVVGDIGALVFLGPSGSGKSTFALCVAEHLGFALLGNDYLFVRGDVVSALPVVYRIGIGTAAGSGALRHWIERFGTPRAGILGPPASTDPRVYGSPVKFEVTPMDLAERLGRDVAERAEIGAIVLSGLRPGDDPLLIEEADKGSALAAAREELRVPVGAPWVRPWVRARLRDPAELESLAGLRVRELLRRRRVLRVTVGVETLRADPAEVAQRIVAAALDAGRS